jgi:hypothetical protein
MSHLARLAESFPDLPVPVLLKLDLLRLGVRLVQDVGTRHYHHHDESGQKPVDARAHLQGSIQLPEGPHVFIAHNPSSPYVLQRLGGEMWLNTDNGRDGRLHPLCTVKEGPAFGWATRRTSTGTPMGTVFSPSLGGACGPIASFLLRHCEFAAHDEECRFCSWVRMGKSTEMRPNVVEMRETLKAIHDEQGSVGYLAFSGGSLFNRTKEADAFLTYMSAVRETGVPLPTTVAAIQALDRADSLRLEQAGFDYACYSMEVWNERAWQAVLPGKTRSVGRQRWMECLEEAVDVFGPGRVLCNFVAGVETAVAGAFNSPEAAAESTVRGFRWCYEHGIYPKYAVWIGGGGARFGDRAPAPLAYYARLLTERQRMFSEYALPVPATDCGQCLTQSCEADLALLDPARFGRGAAAPEAWHRHAPAATAA